jgi:hypothetical protein
MKQISGPRAWAPEVAVRFGLHLRLSSVFFDIQRRSVRIDASGLTRHRYDLPQVKECGDSPFWFFANGSQLRFEVLTASIGRMSSPSVDHGSLSFAT